MVANDVELNGFLDDLVLASKGVLGEKTGTDENLRSWFYTFLKALLKEICGLHCGFWPFPPMLGDGQCVDLLKLFLVVRENGGYAAVSQNGLWDLVAKESGLDLEFASSVKLVYIKYLDALEKWLGRLVDDKESNSRFSDNETNDDGVLMELRTKFKEFLSVMGNSKCLGLKSELQLNVSSGEVEDEESMLVESSKSVVDFMEVEKTDDAEKSGIIMDDDSSNGVEKCIGVKKNLLSDLMKSEKLDTGDEVKSGVMEIGSRDKNEDENDVLELDSAAVEELIASRKRKRESFCKMLSWITGIARNPCDPVVPPLPEMSKWKSCGNEESWKQVLSVREVLFLNRDINRQKNQKMHPYMYDDNVGSSYKLRERSNTSKKRGPGKTSSQMQTCSQSSSAATQNESGIEGSCDGDSSTESSVLDLPVNKRIPLGPDFQAEVPEWTDVASESDPKWAGTRVWPLEKIQSKLIIEREPIGKGRQDSCGCLVPKSIECVRFHCSERKLRVRRELGTAYHHWRLDKMGEEVKLSWTPEEEKKFKSIVRSNPASLDKCFWDEIAKSFHYKRREDLVSYYFNVFLLERRAQQNRYTPSKIDSDDDESDCGSGTHGPGHEASKSPGSLIYSAKKLQNNGK